MKKLLFVISLSVPAIAAASDSGFLSGSIWQEASDSVTCNIDPELLYAIALWESRRSDGSRMTPHQFALRNSVSGPAFPGSSLEAEKLLLRYIGEDRLTDIGAMQINYRWNGNRVDNPVDLLDLKTNVRVGAEILCESIIARPDDMALAIGGYHTRNPEREMAARDYGMSVISLWKKIQGRGL